MSRVKCILLLELREEAAVSQKAPLYRQCITQDLIKSIFDDAAGLYGQQI